MSELTPGRARPSQLARQPRVLDRPVCQHPAAMAPRLSTGASSWRPHRRRTGIPRTAPPLSISYPHVPSDQGRLMRDGRAKNTGTIMTPSIDAYGVPNLTYSALISNAVTSFCSVTLVFSFRFYSRFASFYRGKAVIAPRLCFTP